MLKNVLIGTNVSYTSAATPAALASGEIGVYSMAEDGTYTLISSAISASQALLPVVIAQGVPAGYSPKIFTIQPKQKTGYVYTTYTAPSPNVYTVGYDGVTSTYDLVSGLAGNYTFNIKNTTSGNPPFPALDSTVSFTTNAAANSANVALAAAKDLNLQSLNAVNSVMPSERFAYVEILSGVTTSAPTSTPTATATVGSYTVTLSATSVSIVPGVWLKLGSATATTAPIYKVANVDGVVVTLESPYVNPSVAYGTSVSGIITGFASNASVIAAVAGLRITETGNVFNGSQVMEQYPNKTLNVAVSGIAYGSPVTNNKSVSKVYTTATGAPSGYVSAAGATSSGTTITVGSTVGLVEGMVVTVTAGTGTFAAGTKVVSITNATTFVVSATPSVALSGGASVVTGVTPTYTEGNGVGFQIFKKELVQMGYDGIMNRIYLPDNYPTYTLLSTKYVTLGLQFFSPVTDYTAQGFRAGDARTAIIAVPLASGQAASLHTILNSSNW